MFPKENRFPTRIKGDFFAKAKKHSSSLLVLYTKENNLEIGRATVIVPKKVIAKSTMRSEIKRHLRNSLVPHLGKIIGYDVVLYLKAWKLGVNRERILAEVNSLFE